MAEDNQINTEGRTDASISTGERGRLCVRCGYDLRATPVDGMCPECSAPCRWSEWTAVDGGGQWRWRLMWGAILLTCMVFFSLFLEYLWSFYVFSQFQRNVRMSWWVYWLVEVVSPYSLMLVGVFLMTTPLPGTHDSEPILTVRRITRWLVVCGAGGKIAEPFVYMWLIGGEREMVYRIYGHEVRAACVHWASTLYPWIVLIMLTAGSVMILFFIRKLMIQFRASDLARHVKILMWVVVGYLLLKGTWWIIQEIVRSMYENDIDSLLVIYSSTGFRLVNLTIAWGSLPLYLWGVVVLWKVSRRLGRSMSLRWSGVVG